MPVDEFVLGLSLAAFKLAIKVILGLAGVTVSFLLQEVRAEKIIKIANNLIVRIML